MFYLPVAILGSLVVIGLIARPVWPAEMLLGLFPQLTLAAIVAAFLLFGLGRPWPAAVAALLAVAAIAGIVMRPLPAAELLEGDGSLRIVWANVFDQEDSLARVIAFAQRENADLIMIAEAPAGGISGISDDDYPYKDGSIAGHKSAVAVLSRLPIESATVPRAPGRKGLTFRVALPGGGKVSVGAVHPTIPRSPAATRTRSAQISSVFDSLAGEADAIIIGDFNTVPWSPALEKIVRRVSALHVKTGPTWASKMPGLGLPIDLVFTKGDLKARAEVGPAIGSDHFPLMINLRLGTEHRPSRTTR